MPDLRISRVGTIQDVHGEDIEISIQWDAAAVPEDDGEARTTVLIGSEIELGQEEAEEFARAFVSACWQAARQVPGG